MRNASHPTDSSTRSRCSLSRNDTHRSLAICGQELVGAPEFVESPRVIADSVALGRALKDAPTKKSGRDGK